MMKILGSLWKVWTMCRKRGTGFIGRTRRCRAWARSHDVESVSISGQQENATCCYPYYLELEKEVKLFYRHRVCGTNTSKSGARVRRPNFMQACRMQSYSSMTCMNFEEYRQRRSLALLLEQRGTTRQRGPCVLTPKTRIIGTYHKTRYTSQRSIRLDPVREIYARRPWGNINKQKQVHRTEAHNVTDSQRYHIEHICRRYWVVMTTC